MINLSIGFIVRKTKKRLFSVSFEDFACNPVEIAEQAFATKMGWGL